MTGGTVLDRILELDHYGEREAASVRTTQMLPPVIFLDQIFFVSQPTAHLLPRCQAVADVLNALQYLHDQNITHRDLKPENLLYGEKPMPRNLPRNLSPSRL